MQSDISFYILKHCQSSLLNTSVKFLSISSFRSLDSSEYWIVLRVAFALISLFWLIPCDLSTDKYVWIHISLAWFSLFANLTARRASLRRFRLISWVDGIARRVYWNCCLRARWNNRECQMRTFDSSWVMYNVCDISHHNFSDDPKNMDIR